MCCIVAVVHSLLQMEMRLYFFFYIQADLLKKCFQEIFNEWKQAMGDMSWVTSEICYDSISYRSDKFELTGSN